MSNDKKNKPMGFLAELKRRNVFRVGIAYLVLGWVVVQVTDTVSSALSLPEWTLSLVIWLGVIGFPFALLFAWAFELTAEGLKREHEVDRSQSITHHTGRKVDFAIIGLLLFAVVFLVVDRYTGQVTPVTEPLAIAVVPIEVTPEAAQTKVYDSIAVLPFTNMSNDPEQEYFSDGITEELLNSLARLRNLKVSARTSSFAFKNQKTDIREIGKALNVETVLEGSLRKSGTRLRITAQLIDVESGFHLWSQTYDRELDDVFAVQDDITAQIMSALKVHLEAGETGQVTTTINTAAYEAYLKGRQKLHERMLESIVEAEAFFEVATALDENFALAWAGQALAVFLQSETSYGSLERETVFIRTEALINRALALAPEMAEVNAVRGLIYMDQWRYLEALIAIDRAIDSAPGVAEFHLWRSNTLSALGRWQESNEELESAFKLDPLHPAILANRVGRSCAEGGMPVSQALFAPLARYPRQQAESQAYCLLQNGELAQAFKVVADIERGMQPFVRMALKDCEIPWLVGSDPQEDAFPQALYCQGEESAMTAYNTLSEYQKKDVFVRDYLSILQLRQGEYTQSLATLDELYPHGVASPDLRQGMTSGSNQQLNRVLALQKVGRNDEATLILAKHRQVLEQAKRDGVLRGYHLLEAKMALLTGDQEGGLRSLDAAFRGFEVTWVLRDDPVLLELVGQEQLAEKTVWLDHHIDAERAKLGWTPAGPVGSAKH